MPGGEGERWTRRTAALRGLVRLGVCTLLAFIGGLTALIAFSVAGAIEGFGGASRGVWLSAFAAMLIGAGVVAVGIALFRIKRPDDPFGPPPS